MSEQQIDHAANIINLMQEKDQQLSTLSANYRQVLGEREDLDLELNRSVMVERELRLDIRRIERKHEEEEQTLKDRIAEVTGFCNEQTQTIHSLRKEVADQKARPVNDCRSFVMHMILMESVNYLHEAVDTLNHAFVNKATNKVSTELLTQVLDANTLRRPSLYRIATRMMSNEDKAITDLDMTRKSISEFVSNNYDLFCKDPAYNKSRNVLLALARAAKQSAGKSGALRTARMKYSDITLLDNVDRQLLEDEDDYEEMFVESIAAIFIRIVEASNFPEI